MERISAENERGLSSRTIRILAMVLVAAGLVGTVILQRGILGVGTGSNSDILNQMNQSASMMTLATVSLLLQAAETCAIPLAALLLVERALDTEFGISEVVSLLVMALISEIPFDFALTGHIWMMKQQNPLFGATLALVMLYFFKQYQSNGIWNTAIKIFVLLAAVLWSTMFHVQHGTVTLILTAVLWGMRDKMMFRGFVGIAAGVLCSVFSPFYLASPMGFLLIHFYNGVYSEKICVKQLALYPCFLILIGVITSMMI